MEWRDAAGQPIRTRPGGDDPAADLAALLGSQRLAVLITAGNEGPHGSLVAFLPSPDFRELIFATSRATLKYENLVRQPRVALLVDDRSNQAADFRRAAAVTAYGPAREADGEERAPLAAAYLARHPDLRDFVATPDCALVRVTVERYRLVRRFQDMTILVPSP
jgi:heme iron utilization protein